MLQCVAVCCSVLHMYECIYSVHITDTDIHFSDMCCSVLQCVAVCCSVLQCVTVCYSVVQCGAVCCSVLQCVAVLHMYIVYIIDANTD